MSRGLGRLERGILAAIEKHKARDGLAFVAPEILAKMKADPNWRCHVEELRRPSPTLFNTVYLHNLCHPRPVSEPYRALTLAQRKAIVRAMHSFVRKFPQYALIGGKGREAVLWLYEPGDPLSKIWAELTVKFGYHAPATLSDAKSVAKGGEPSDAIRHAREHRSYLRGARVVNKSDRIREVDDIAALAKKARKLITQNDHDAIRAGLAEIADALDAIGQPEPLAEAAD